MGAAYIPHSVYADKAMILESVAFQTFEETNKELIDFRRLKSKTQEEIQIDLTFEEYRSMWTDAFKTGWKLREWVVNKQKSIEDEFKSRQGTG